MVSPSPITVRSGPSPRPDGHQPRGQAPQYNRCNFGIRAAAAVAEIEAARAQSDRLDDIAEGYSEALAQLIIPDGPEGVS